MFDTLDRDEMTRFSQFAFYIILKMPMSFSLCGFLLVLAAFVALNGRCLSVVEEVLVEDLGYPGAPECRMG